jgi:hypothetical protein
LRGRAVWISPPANTHRQTRPFMGAPTGGDMTQLIRRV